MDHLGAEVVRTFYRLMSARVDTIILALRKAKKSVDEVQERGLTDCQYILFKGVEGDFSVAKAQLKELQNEFRTFPVICGNQMANL